MRFTPREFEVLRSSVNMLYERIQEKNELEKAIKLMEEQRNAAQEWNSYENTALEKLTRSFVVNYFYKIMGNYKEKLQLRKASAEYSKERLIVLERVLYQLKVKHAKCEEELITHNNNVVMYRNAIFEKETIVKKKDPERFLSLNKALDGYDRQISILESLILKATYILEKISYIENKVSLSKTADMLGNVPFVFGDTGKEGALEAGELVFDDLRGEQANLLKSICNLAEYEKEFQKECEEGRNFKIRDDFLDLNYTVKIDHIREVLPIYKKYLKNLLHTCDENKIMKQKEKDMAKSEWAIFVERYEISA